MFALCLLPNNLQIINKTFEKLGEFDFIFSREDFFFFSNKNLIEFLQLTGCLNLKPKNPFQDYYSIKAVPPH